MDPDIEWFAAQGWLKYLCFVPEADLPTFNAGTQTFAFPSAYEGFGLPVLDAMVSGVAVVESDQSSIPEVTQGAALLGDSDDLKVLSTYLARSLEDDVWRNKTFVRGIDVAEGFTCQRCMEKTITH
jgi:alpha-1,3-rhamnosyl/mannosyltransferase